MQKLLYILLIGAGTVACKKEPLPDLPEGNSPYYTLKGNVGEEIIDLAVGDNNVTISGGTSDLNGIETYYGEIQAPQNDLLFRVELIEPELISNQLEIIPENIDLIRHDANCMYLDFGSTGASQANFVLTENEDGILSPSALLTFKEFGLYEKEFQFADFGLETFTIPVNYGFNKTSLNAGFSTSGYADSLSIVPNFVAGEHKWYVNDKLLSEDVNYTFSIANGIYKVTHEVKDLNDNTSSFTTLIRIKNDEFYWQMGLNYCDDETPVNNFGKVKISVRKDGVWYYSDHSTELPEEFFSAQNIEYTVNEDFAVENAIFDIALKAKLFNVDHSASIDLDNLSGRFKIGLK